MLGAAMLPRYLRSPTADADSAFLCRAEGVQALEVIEDVTDFEGPMDANMTETDFEVSLNRKPLGLALGSEDSAC